MGSLLKNKHKKVFKDSLTRGFFLVQNRTIISTEIFADIETLSGKGYIFFSYIIASILGKLQNHLQSAMKLQFKFIDNLRGLFYVFYTIYLYKSFDISKVLTFE